MSALKIIELRAENIKRIRALSIRPDGRSVVIGGNNGQGKSSALDSILYAMGGTGSICDKPLRKGEKRGEIVLDMGSLIVTRKFNENGSSLVVKTKEGDIKTSPQGVLDALNGQLSFDPLEFSRMDSKKQRDTLARLAGLDLSEIDLEYQRAFNKRTEVNRLPVQIRATMAGKTETPNLPDKEQSSTDLLAQIEAANQFNEQVKQKKADARQADDRAKGFAADAAVCERTVARLKAELAAAEEAHKDALDLAKSAREAADTKLKHAEALTLQEVEPLKKQLCDLEHTNYAVRTNLFLAEKRKELAKAENEIAALTKQLEGILERKQEMICSAKYPLEGLTVDDGAVFFGGIPLKQASTAEQIKISTAIGMALNPKLRVMLIRDGAMLDENSMAALLELAEEHDVQLWIERVGDGQEVSVVIEDGAVVENRMEELATEGAVK